MLILSILRHANVIAKPLYDKDSKVFGYRIEGCKLLTKEQWENGLPENYENWNQNNCPLLIKLEKYDG